MLDGCVAGKLEHLSFASCQGTIQLSNVRHLLRHLVTLDLSNTTIHSGDVALMVVRIIAFLAVQVVGGALHSGL